MAKVRVNADDVGDDLEAILDGFNFELPGEDQSLGRDLVGLVAQGIADRSVPDAEDPGGGTWDPNEARYAARKRQRYDADQPGILSGQMLSLESLKGQPNITGDRIEMVYGTGERPGSTARNGAPLRDHEREATDREKAQWFTDGGRAFYELDQQISDDVIKATSEAFDEYVREQGA